MPSTKEAAIIAAISKHRVELTQLLLEYEERKPFATQVASALIACEIDQPVTVGELRAVLKVMFPHANL